MAACGRPATRALDNDRNTYVAVVMNSDLLPVRQELLDRGVDVGDVRRSTDNEFLWFHDLDSNRFELNRPPEVAGEASAWSR